MSLFTKLKVFLTIVISVVLSYLTYSFLLDYKTDTTVVVAAVEIKEREVLRADMLTTKRINDVQKKSILPKAATEPSELADGMVSKIKIPQGKVIDKQTDVIPLDPNVIKKDENGEPIKDTDISQAYFITANQRLLAVKLSNEGSVNGKIRKGDVVDVLGTFETSSGVQDTLTLAQRVEVYDIPVASEDSKDVEEQVIVLKLDNSKQAGSIAWMQTKGRIDLALCPAKKSANSDALELPVTEDSILKRLGS